MQEIEFMKPGSLNPEELDALVSVMQIAGQQKTLEGSIRGDIARPPSKDKTVASLEAMGVQIFGLNEANLDDANSDISWENIAGYNQQKRYLVPTLSLFCVSEIVLWLIYTGKSLSSSQFGYLCFSF